MEGNKKKKVIDQSLEELRRKFGKEEPEEEGVFRASPIVADNATALMALVNNLYVGNLAAEVSEEMLAKIYSKYGEVESIKLMQPRTEEERKRKRNCAFIKFYKYEAAYLAKEELAEKFLFGQ